MYTVDGPVTLATIANGALEDRFQREWQKILNNIFDPNTSLKEKRKLIVDMTFTPNDERNFPMISITVKSKLSPAKPVTTACVLTNNNKKIVAQEIQTEQQPLFSTEVFEEESNVINFRTGEVR